MLLFRQFAGGELDTAIASHNQALKLDPNYLDGLLNRGIAYRKKGDKFLALADFMLIQQLAPRHARRIDHEIRLLQGTP